ncbi:hypothetical protein EDD18DRAFT_1358355 [Armillaria luteobubalina]|uniref:Uncharacterized protein n=1 Tax=Armillaria luteobubalina TaxID=153913 RepID=A0AA39PWM8_9AGAR|nr:hypothetical protein EDD18DRAFT_1358355 [Armillaria luteobubalina]
MLPFVRSIVIESKPTRGIWDFTAGDCFLAVHDLIIRSQCHATLTHLAVYDALLGIGIFDILSELPLLMDLAFHFTRWYESCDSIIHDIIVALSSVIKGDASSGLCCLNPALTRFAVITSGPPDNGQGSIGFVCSHLASMVEARCDSPFNSLSRLSVTVQASSPGLDFPCMSDGVIARLADCRSFGHNIRVAGIG